MTTLINTLTSERGELFALGHGRRVLLARCRPEIRVYEKETAVPVLGELRRGMKTMRFVIALCGEMELARDAPEAERYELTADIIRNDGIAERFYFHSVELVEINHMGEWEFDVRATAEQTRKLLEMSGA